MSEDNADRDRRLYTYPDSNVLRNKLDIRDPARLELIERQLVTARIEQGVPSGNFDLTHLKAIHRHMFQDVYAWAGQLRQVDFHKTSWFLPTNRIEMGMADVHRRLVDRQYLLGLSADGFAAEAAEIISDINHAHPFREGNGRTQLQYLKQLGARAGHRIDLTRFDRQTWIAASIASHDQSNDPMRHCIRRAIVRPEKSRTQTLRMRSAVKRQSDRKIRRQE